MRRGRRARFAVISLLAFIVAYYLVLPQLVTARSRADELLRVKPLLLLPALGLQVAALVSYSCFTRSFLETEARPPVLHRMFRIQLATKALSNLLPGGSAAGSALGYRLLVAEGVPGTAAGFSLAAAGFGSAVILNLILVTGLVMSLPNRSVNTGYATVAGVTIAVLLVVGALLVLLVKGQEAAARWAKRLPFIDGEKAARVVRQLAWHLRDLATDRPKMLRAALWGLANWLLDAASLWVFLRAFGQSAPIDGLLVSFAAANVSASIPITPGGAGVVELVLTAALTGFGLVRDPTLLGVAVYRGASWLLPIPVGAIAYLSLRVGSRPAEEAMRVEESVVGFAERSVPSASDGSRVAHKDSPTTLPLPSPSSASDSGASDSDDGPAARTGGKAKPGTDRR